MSSSEDDEGKPLLDAAVDPQYHEMTADDDHWLRDTVPRVTRRRQSKLAKLAMQSYEQVDDFVELAELDGPSTRRPVVTDRRTAHQPRPHRSMTHSTQPVQSCFDDRSKLLYSFLPSVHPLTVGQLNTVIASSGHTLQVDCASQISHIAPGFSYNDMLRYLLLTGETVLTPQGKQVIYGKVILRNEQGKEYRKFPKGQAVMTNKRLLFLSCEHMQRTSLRVQNASHARYDLLAKEGDATVYVPVPLSCIRSVELVSYGIVSSGTEIVGTPGCCNNMFQCLSACFPRAITNWSAGNVVRERVVERILRVGLLMPPWGEKTTAEIHLHPAFSVALATEFLSALQKHVLPRQE